MKKFMMILSVVSCLGTYACSGESSTGPDTEHLPPDVILQWNEAAYEAFGGVAYQHSLMASRINAMVHIAMHDALNAIYPEYARYTLALTDPLAHPVPAAANAAYTVLVHEIPDRKPFLDSILQSSLAGIPDGDAKTRGLALGKAAGEAMLTLRANDGANANPIHPVTPSKAAGVYQPVPPFDFVFAPFWKDLQPFGLHRQDQFRPAPPPSVTEKAYTDAFLEVMQKGRRNSDNRMPDETAYAYFWYEFSEAGWNRVARIAIAQLKLNLWDAARLLALTDIAIADAYIAGWDAKFHYNLWRPYTAIRQAHMDGNALTEADSLWESELVTPPVQDFPSTHSALGNAAASVLSALLGDSIPFHMTSPTALPGTGPRHFSSFRQAADENADSRVMAGIHFRFACASGQNLGDKIGQWIVDHHLKPLK